MTIRFARTALTCGTRQRRCGGFTLVELTTAMGVMCILLVAMASAVSFSANVLGGQGAVNQTNLLASADAADQMTDDLNVATAFTERTGTSLTFTVPDRVANGTPNQIRYAWTGSGHPLTRQFCAANSPLLSASSSAYPAVALLGNVTNLAFTPLFRQMGTPAVSDALVSSSSAGLLGTASTYNIDAQHWLRQTFTPAFASLPGSYTITRVQVQMQASGPQDCTLAVQLSGKTTSGATLSETEPLYEAALSTSTAEYAEVPFKTMTGLSPSSVVTMTISYSSGTGVGAIASYETSIGLGILSGATWSTSSNAGSTWTAASILSCLQFNIYGTTP
jgi:Tfp pilus assembly protein PilE